MHVIRVPGGSGRSCAWGWNPNLERIQQRAKCLYSATLLGVHARVESARGTLCVYVYLVTLIQCAHCLNEEGLVNECVVLCVRVWFMCCGSAQHIKCIVELLG